MEITNKDLLLIMGGITIGTIISLIIFYQPVIQIAVWSGSAMVVMIIFLVQVFENRKEEN